MLYFAYGSNLHPRRLQARIGRLELVATGIFPGRQLAFHKRGQDGSAKCDATPDPSPQSGVYGALYRINEEAIGLLDGFEGRGHGYEVETIHVRVENRDMEAMTYLAQPAYIDDSLQPFGWYKDLVVAGARFHGFPEKYIRRIRSMACVADPDLQRENTNRAAIRGQKTTNGENIRL